MVLVIVSIRISWQVTEISLKKIWNGLDKKRKILYDNDICYQLKKEEVFADNIAKNFSKR